MSEQTLVFTAGEKKYIGPGNFLRIDSASGEVELKFKRRDTGIDEEHIAEQGDRFIFSPAPGNHFAFDSVEIVSDTAQTIHVTTSTGEKTSDKIAGSIEVQPASGLATAPDVSAIATATTQIVAVNTGRKRIHIANTSTTVTLRHGDVNTGAARGAPLYPGMTVVLENTAAVYVYNPDAVAVTVAITEES